MEYGTRVYVKCRDIEHGPCSAGRDLPRDNEVCGTMEECAGCTAHPKRVTYETTKKFDYAWEHPMVVVEQAGTPAAPAPDDEKLNQTLDQIKNVLEKQLSAAGSIDGGVQKALRQGAETGAAAERAARLLEQILQKAAGGGPDIDVEKVKALSNFDVQKIKDHTAVGSSFGELVKLLLLALTNNI